MNEEVIKNMTDLHCEVFGDRYINPISNGDIRIITLLLEILKKCGKEEVSRVFEKYKMVGDKDIEEKLTRLSLNIPTKKLVGGVSVSTKGVALLFGDFNHTCIKVSEIFSWEKTEDEYGNPAILLNGGSLDVTYRPLIYNTVLSYTDEHDRDDDFDLIVRRKNG